LKRKFVTNLALLLFLNLLVKPFWMFGIDRTVQNTVGAEEYGFYFSLFSFSILINILLDMGITNFNNRSIAREISILPEYFSNIVPLKFLLAIVYAVVCILGGLILGYSEDQFNMLFLLIFNNFLLSFILYLRSNISGLHFFRTDSVLSVLDRFLMILICSFLLWGKFTDKPFNIVWFIYAQTASYLATMFIALGIVLSFSGKIRLQFRLNYTYSILRKSFPFAILILMMSVFNRVDSVMIERMLPDGKEQAGLYAQAFRILDAVTMFAFLFAGLLLPMFSRMIKQHEQVGQLLKLCISLLMIPAFTLVIISSFYGSEIMKALYNEHVDISSRIYARLIFTFLFISVTYIFGTLLTANGNLKHLNILAGITVFINITLNLILIPRYKAEGAACSSVVSQGFFAISQIILSKKIFLLKPDYSIIIRFIGFVLLLTISGVVFEKLNIPWINGFLLLSLLGVILSLLLRIITPKVLYSIIKFGE
jgi:O-antigen/teichoic acid export membrane protein